MTHHLALYTFGIFAKPADDPVNQLFFRLNDSVFSAVARAPGLIARSGYDDEPDGPPSWGPMAYPRFLDESADDWAPATLSLWQDAASLRAFAYQGIHGAALKKRESWFIQNRWPAYVLWWHPTGDRPNWALAAGRLERLHDRGPSQQAFDFARFHEPPT